MRDGVKLIAFADDVAVVAVAHDAWHVEQLVNPTLDDIVVWMTTNGPKLAPEKAECVVLTKKRSFRPHNLYIQGHQIQVKRAIIRYLGVHLDTRLSFVEHATTAALGARKAASAIGRLMPNVGGPTQTKRQLLISVVHSLVLYGAAVWSDQVLSYQKSRESCCRRRGARP